MNDKEKNNSVFTIKNEKGMEEECGILFTFEAKETGKNYIVYTNYTKDEGGELNTFVKMYDPTGKNPNLYPVTTIEEYNTAEAILSKLTEVKRDAHE